MEKFQDPGIDWMRHRNCSKAETNVFFSDPDKVEEVRAAKAICRECKVRKECLAFAITHREKGGVWGGMSEKDRRALAIDNALLGSIACADYMYGRDRECVTSDLDNNLEAINE